jgi:hypothetical protein
VMNARQIEHLPALPHRFDLVDPSGDHSLADSRPTAFGVLPGSPLQSATTVYGGGQVGAEQASEYAGPAAPSRPFSMRTYAARPQIAHVADREALPP